MERQEIKYTTFANVIKSLFSILFLAVWSCGLNAQQIPFITQKGNNGVTYLFGMGELQEGCKTSNIAIEGLIVNSEIGAFITFQLPVNKLHALQNSTFFKTVSLSNTKNGMTANNFIALKSSQADKVNQGKSNNLKENYSGKNVVVGIVDIGFQNNHPTFFEETGQKLRIIRYWDQSANGIPPAGYGYGKECADSASIVNAIDNDGSHGTHVAGIAAGSGYSSNGLKHKGVAHGSDLIFVKIKYTNDTLEGSALGDYVVANPTIIDAYAYIFNYAKSVGKPAVINLSWGMHTGPHDGNSLFDKAVEELVKTPGHIIVGANGNNGRDEMHFRYDFTKPDTIKTIAYDRNRWRNTESIYVDIWGAANSNFQFRVHLYDTSKNIVAATPIFNTLNDFEGSSFIHNGIDSLKYTIAIENSYLYNQKPNILFYSKHTNSKKHFAVLEFIGNQGRIDAWNSGDAFTWGSGGFRTEISGVSFSTGFKGGDAENSLGENGGTGKGTISVGAYINVDKWLNQDGKLFDKSNEFLAGQMASFSSYGPSVDGRIKPNISAPGQGIISAVNNYDYRTTGNRDNFMDSTHFNGLPQYWAMFSGTSMAAPHVCGIVALILEANPSLNHKEVLEIIENTATKDNETGNVPNNRWGYGKINALAAVTEAEHRLSVAELAEHQVKIYPNPTEGIIRIRFKSRGPRTYLLYDIQGKVVMRGEFTATNSSLDLSPLQKGVYVLRLNNGMSVSRIVKSK